MNVPSIRRANIALLCIGLGLVLSVMLSQCVAQLNRKSAKSNVSRRVRFTKAECVGAPYKLSHLNYCNMVQFPNGTIGLNVSVHIPIVLNYFEINAKVFYKYSTYRPFMIDWSIEMCQAIRVGKFNPATAFVMKVAEKSVPEYYHPCPHGNRTYKTFWIIEPSYIPDTLPSGDYRVDIFFRDATFSKLLSVQVYCAIRKQGLIAQLSRNVRKANISHTLRITKMQCIGTPYKHTYLHYCQMEQFENGTVGANISIHAPQVINYGEISAKLFYKYTTYRPFMIDWSMEYCQAYRVGKFNPSTALVMTIIKESLPAIYYPCPHGNRTYNIFWMLEPKFIPRALPSGDYRLDVYIRDSTNTNMFALQVFGVVRKQGLLSLPSGSQTNTMQRCDILQVFVSVLLARTVAQLNWISTNSDLSHTLRITKMQCIGVPYKQTILRHCKMQQFQNGSAGLHISADVPMVLNYIEISVKLNYKYTAYRPFMIDYSMEYCQAERTKMFNPSTALMMKVIEESLPDLYYPCPHGNRTYTVFWLFTPKFIPQTTPSGDYRLDIFYRDQSGTSLFALQMFGAFVKDSENGTASHALRITKMQCIGAPYKHTTLNLCKMEQFPNGDVALNISMDIPQVLNYIEISVQVFYKYTTYRPFMVNWNMEYCHTARFGKLNPNAVIMMKVIEATIPDLNYPCPHGNRSYNVCWLYERKFLLPSLPSGDYRMDIYLRDSSKANIIAFQLYGAMQCVDLPYKRTVLNHC
uniref:Uncharacterized protein n=1 Tax=Anopheles dirus TaxID=7168 RepID=A0A182NRB4_9DIPT